MTQILKDGENFDQINCLSMIKTRILKEWRTHFKSSVSSIREKTAQIRCDCKDAERVKNVDKVAERVYRLAHA